ncbi:MAG: glycosyltransferase family 39 protein [bacterium]
MTKKKKSRTKKSKDKPDQPEKERPAKKGAKKPSSPKAPKPPEPSPYQQLLQRPEVRVLLSYWVILVALLCLLQYWGGVNKLFFFQGGDNAEYLNLARSLLDGEYMSINSSPPEPHTKYPPFFPLMLASIILLFGKNMVLMKSLIALSAAVATAGTALLYKQRDHNLIAFLAALLLMSVPFTLSYSIRLLSEIPFTAFVVLTLLFTELALDRDSLKSPYTYLAAIFLVIAYFTRSAGIVLAPVVVGAALLRSPIRPRLKKNAVLAAVMTGPFIIGFLGWSLRNRSVTGGEGTAYWQELLLKDPSNLDSPLIGVGGFISRVGEHFVFYLKELAKTLWPYLDKAQESELIVPGAIIFAVATVGLVRSLLNRRGASELYALFYSALIVIWTFVENRFLIPLYPVLIYYFLKGVETVPVLLSRADKRVGHPAFKYAAILIVSVLLLGSYVPENLDFLSRASRMKRARGVEINENFHIISFNRGMAHMLGVAIYARENTSPDTVIIARKPRLVAFASERTTVGPPFAPEPAEFIRQMEQKRVSYMLVDEVYPAMKEHFQPAINNFRERFQLVYRLPESNSMLFKYTPGKPYSDQRGRE